MNEFLRIAAHVNPMVDGIDFYIVEKGPHGSRRIARNVIMEPMEEWTSPPPAPFWLTRDNAKKLMDDLWNAGIRPTERDETEGALSATKEHLKDMRDIAFGLLADARALNVRGKIIDE
jgi:hypothetical protein